MAIRREKVTLAFDAEAAHAAYTRLYNRRVVGMKWLESRGYRYGDDVWAARRDLGIDMPLRWEGDDS